MNTALAYDLDGNRLPASNDISLPTGTWRGGLRSDTRIYFVSGSQAIAYDYSGTRQSDDDIELGTGRWHGGAAIFEDESVTVPSVPQNLTATAQSNGTSVELDWDAPSDDGGAAISDYEFSSDDGGTFTAIGQQIPITP